MQITHKPRKNTVFGNLGVFHSSIMNFLFRISSDVASLKVDTGRSKEESSAVKDYEVDVS